VLAFANSSKESDSGTGCNLFAGHVAILPNDIRIRKLQSSATIWGGGVKNGIQIRNIQRIHPGIICSCMQYALQLLFWPHRKTKGCYTPWDMSYRSLFLRKRDGNSDFYTQKKSQLHIRRVNLQSLFFLSLKIEKGREERDTRQKLLLVRAIFKTLWNRKRSKIKMASTELYQNDHHILSSVCICVSALNYSKWDQANNIRISPK